MRPRTAIPTPCASWSISEDETATRCLRNERSYLSAAFLDTQDWLCDSVRTNEPKASIGKVMFCDQGTSSQMAIILHAHQIVPGYTDSIGSLWRHTLGSLPSILRVSAVGLDNKAKAEFALDSLGYRR